MPNVLVRDVDEAIVEKLKERARRQGRSLQNELLILLGLFASWDVLSDAETAAVIKDSLRGRIFSDSAALLREDRGR